MAVNGGSSATTGDEIQIEEELIVWVQQRQEVYRWFGCWWGYGRSARSPDNYMGERLSAALWSNVNGACEAWLML